MQRTPPDRATTLTTPVQRPSLKALARKALACNNPDNNLATAPPETVQQTGNETGSKVAQTQSYAATIRDRLLALTTAGGSDPARVRTLSESFLRDLHGMGDDALPALLSMLADDADRERGIVPKDDTAAILCRSCGPVWVHPYIARMLPVVGGWPRSIGCPWCFIRARDIAIPRPHVRCCDCRHRVPDMINPTQGMGRCVIGNESATWPGMRHRCGEFQPVEGVT